MNPGEPHLRRILVWNGWLRVAHGLLAASGLLLIATGWLIAHSPATAKDASDLHQFTATFMLIGLAIRIWLLFRDKTTAGWNALLPQPLPFRGMQEMLKFYLSFGRTPLPRWHAHNPLWLPLYLIMFLLLLAVAVSGLTMQDHPLWLSFIYMPDVHSAAASWLTILTGAHIFAVVLHDAKGNSSDVSGIINGYRVFQWEGGRTGGAIEQPIKLNPGKTSCGSKDCH